MGTHRYGLSTPRHDKGELDPLPVVQRNNKSAPKVAARLLGEKRRVFFRVEQKKLHTGSCMKTPCDAS
jgi:hypothetical protein